MSLFDLGLSPIQGRVVSILSALGSVLSACLYLIRRVNFFACLLFAASIIGIAGSSMVLARYEFIMLLNVTCCIVALGLIHSNAHDSRLIWFVAVLLAFATILSLYAHPQGLIFLPLSAFMLYRLVFDEKPHFLGVGLCLAGLGYCAYTAHTFLNLSCPGFPKIDAYWGEATFNALNFNTSIEQISGYFTEKFDLYASRFTYHDKYQSDLPAITAETIQSSPLLKSMNTIIPIILFVVISFNVIASIFLATFYMGYYFVKHMELFSIKFDTSVFFLLLFIPAFSLFSYDVGQNFYRSIALHFLFVLALTILLADVPAKFARHASLLFGSIFLITAVLSLYANKVYFSERLKAIDGSALSLSRNWGGITTQVKKLASSCGIDLASGKAIVSNYTYEGLKQYDTIYHINYLALQKDITKLSMGEMVTALKPNYAIAMCSDMEGAGFTLPIQERQGELCCYNFPKQDPHD